jgi:hypothetical protein
MISIRTAVLTGVAAVGVLTAVFPTASAHGAGAAELRAGKEPNLTLSTSPASLDILAAPCGARTVDIGVRNDDSTAVYADVLLTPDEPLTTSPEVISSYLPAGYELQVPVRVSAPAGSAATTGEIVVQAGRSGRGDTLTVPVTVTPPPSGPGANLALGASVTASSSHGNFPPCRAIDGNANSEDWQTLTGWNDGTSRVFPDWLALELAQPQQLSKVVVHTLDSSRYPAPRYGLADWDVQVLANGTWQTVASVRDNTVGVVTSTFPPVTTASVRILALASNDANYSRIVELGVYS